MSIPKTTGYNEIVKIAEAALKGDKEMAKKYINKFLIKHTHSDLVYPFTHLLNGENNPSGLTLEQKTED